MIRILVDNEEDRAAVLAAMERGRLTDLLLHPFVVACDHGNLLPDATGEDSAPGAVEANGFCAAPERRLLVMADAGDASPGPTIRRGEREELQREWIAASAEYGRRAGEALTKAADVPAGACPWPPPRRRAGGGMGSAGQGWATLSHAEAVRSIAAAGTTPGRAGVNTSPST